MPKTDGRDSTGSRSSRSLVTQTRSDHTAEATRDSSTGHAPAPDPLAIMLAEELKQSTFEQHAALLGDSRMSEPANAGVKTLIVQRLQGTHGNRYVQRLVDHISSTPEHSSERVRRSRPTDDFYQQAARRLRERPNGTLQTKLTVGPADDQYEQEADRVAKDIVLSLRSDDVEEAGPEQVRLQSVPQSKVGPEGGDVEADVEQDIRSARGGGKSLPNTLRSSMENSFGADFSGVKVHSSSQSDALNQRLGSRAFTVGQDIFVRREDYNPGSTEGQELLAHELTHVVQQNGRTIRRAEGDDEESDKSFMQTLKDEGIVAATGRQITAIEDGISAGVQVAEEKLTGWRKAIANWWDSKVMSKFPWIGTFLKGVAGIVVNPLKLGWSGVKLVVKIGWLILKSSLTTVLRNFGKLLDFARALFGDKDYEKVGLFEDSRPWKADWDNIPDKVEQGKTARWWGLVTEVIGIWGNNLRDWSGWISIVTGLIGLIPGAQASLAVAGMAAAISGLVRPIATSATTLASIINSIDWGMQSYSSSGPEDEQAELAISAKERAKRTGGRLLGDVLGMAAMGLGKGIVGDPLHPDASFTETVAKGSSTTETLGLAEYGGDFGTNLSALQTGQDMTVANEALNRGAATAAKGVSGDVTNIGKKGVAKSTEYYYAEDEEKKEMRGEAQEALRKKGEALLDSLIKGLQDVHGTLGGIARILTTTVKVVVDIVGGLVTVLAGIGDIFAKSGAKVINKIFSTGLTWDWTLFEGAKAGWAFVREHWVDGARDWVNEKVDFIDGLITRMRENNPFKKKPEEPSE